jgi:hypothetical protein
MKTGISGRLAVLNELTAKYGDITIIECIEREEAEESLRRR